MTNTIGVVICAAGQGTRAQFGKNKLYAKLGERTVLEETLSRFQLPYISQIVVAVNKADYQDMQTLCSAFPNTQVVEGGETRSLSVASALQSIQTDVVLIHDGARPYVSQKVIENCIDSVQRFGSGICAIPCTDTIAFASENTIESVPARHQLHQIQTPQAFFTKEIIRAYACAQADGNAYTDDASVYARYVSAPHLCEGDARNVKLTYPCDFIAQTNARCGFGVDTHAFGKAQDFVLLGGVKIPSKSGLVAHSDGDVVVHALMDALLSACGLKDIGHYFPDTDERWKGANSMQMLATVLALVKENGYLPSNVSIAIQAQTPRLAPYIDEMQSSLATALSLPRKNVGITAGTNEGLGYVGEGKGITVYAFILLNAR